MGLKPSTDQEHRYQLCGDEYCDRFPCRVYKEGQRDGYDDGYRKGYDDGYAAGFGAGYSEGFGDGLASCPGPHGSG
jgi:flagellar biosynthesis/type III secretory pathway protein FliH